MNGDESPRTFLIDANTDEIAESYYGNQWRAVDTPPSTGNIEVLSVKGIVRGVPNNNLCSVIFCPPNQGDALPRRACAILAEAVITAMA